MKFDDDRKPQLQERVNVHAGRFNGRWGEVREVDSKNKMVRVWAPGLLGNESVLLKWSEITPR